MATVNIKQNNINFTVDDVNTPKSWNPMAGSTFAPADLGTDFNINMLKTAETEGWLNDLRILHGLFIDWDGAQITLNGTTYTIHNTGELFSAIENANKTYSLGDYQGKLKSRAFYTKYNELLSRINKLIDDKTSYIEPLSKSITYKWYDRTGVNIGDEEGIYLNGKVTMLPSDGMNDLEENFIGWRCELDGILYQPGETFTLTQELYDLCEDGYLIQFRAMTEPKTYQVGIDVTNGEWLGTSPQTVKYGGYAYWKVYANDGYKLPTSVINGTIFDDNQYYENNSQMVTSNKVTEDFTVYVNCEEDISYIEPEYPPVEYSFWIDGVKVYENSVIDLNETITIPAPQDGELGDNKDLFEGWICELNGNLYQPGDQYTLTQEDYDKIIYGDTFIFNASFKDSYLVRINVTHGYCIPDSSPRRIKTGEQASWEVSAFDGYKLPTSVTNGTISGNTVTSNIVTNDFTVYVVCEEDISNTEPGLTDPE